MKELHADVNEDLDAGWDEIAPAAKTIAAAVVESQPPEVEELDAGWEIESKDPVPEKKGHKQRAIPSIEVKVQAQPAATHSQVTLTKKARRELERQNRIHAAKRRADAKVQKKEQRRTGQGKVQPDVSQTRSQDLEVRTPEVPTQNGLVRTNKPKHPKPKGQSARRAKKHEAKATTPMGADLDANLEAAPVVTSHVDSNPRSAQLWWVVAIIFLAVGALALVWLRH